MSGISNLYGGMSDSDYLVSQGQFIYSEGIDCKRVPEYMQLERKPINKCEITGTATCFCNVFDNNGDFLIGGVSGEVRTSTGILLGTIPGGTIINISKFTTYLGDAYIINLTNQVGYVLASAGYTAGAWTGQFVTLITQPSDPALVTSTYAMTINTKTLLYFVNYRSIYSISSSLIVNFRTIAEDDIVGLAQHGTQYRVYTESGKMYLWDGFSKLFDVSYSTGLQTRYIHTHQTTDYVVSGEGPLYSVMYLASGSMPQYLKKANKSKLVGKTKYAYDSLYRGSNATMGLYNNTFYSYINDNGAWKIESFGAEYPGYPQSFNVLATTNGFGEVIDKGGPIICPIGDSSKINYYSRAVGGRHTISYIPLDSTGTYQYLSSGVLYTKRYDDLQGKNAPYSQKETIDLQIRCDVPANTQIIISYLLNGSGSYTSRITINPAIAEDWDSFRFRKYKLDISVRYYDISFKIELKTTDPMVTPKLYQMIFNSQEVKA